MFDRDHVGVLFDVPGDELRKHCLEKAKYHEERMKFYEAQSKRFKDEIDDISKKMAHTYSNTTAVSNKDRMEQSKSHHADRSRFFKFASSHLKKTTYEISKAELASFEMIPA